MCVRQSFVHHYTGASSFLLLLLLSIAFHAHRTESFGETRPEHTQKIINVLDALFNSSLREERERKCNDKKKMPRYFWSENGEIPRFNITKMSETNARVRNLLNPRVIDLLRITGKNSHIISRLYGIIACFAGSSLDVYEAAGVVFQSAVEGKYCGAMNFCFDWFPEKIPWRV